MTLGDLANYVCGKINQTDATDLGICKGFLQRRFEMIWADQLWKDSLFEYTQQITSVGYTPAATWLPTKKVLLVAPAISLVVAVRTDTRKLDVESSETLYRYDADIFAQSGMATQFRNLSPCVWEFDTPTDVDLVLTDDADLNSVARATVLGTDGLTLASSSYALGDSLNDLGTVSRIDAVGKGQTTNPVLLVWDDGSPVTIAGAGANQVNGQLPRTGLLNGKPQFGAAGLVEAQWTAGAPPAWNLLYALGNNYYAAYSSADDVAYPSLVGKWAPVGPGTPPLPTVTGGFTTLGTMQGTDLAMPKRCRIGLIGIVTDNTVLRILGKVRAPAFSADSDEPALTGVENCLISFAMGDMLQRERQYGKAQAMVTEGTQLLEQLKRTQVVQQASNKRFIPQDGYGPDYQQYNSPLTF